MNPWLYDLIGNTTAVPLTMIITCTSNPLPSPIGDSFTALVSSYLTSVHDAEVLACAAAYYAPQTALTGAGSLIQAYELCVAQPLYHIYVSAAPTAIYTTRRQRERRFAHIHRSARQHDCSHTFAVLYCLCVSSISMLTMRLPYLH